MKHRLTNAEMIAISTFMITEKVVMARLISFFSTGEPGVRRYCGPRELLPFWASLTEDERAEYRDFAMGLKF